MAMLTSEIRFVVVIVVIVCASLGAASGVESTLDISGAVQRYETPFDTGTVSFVRSDIPGSL